ncbi:MAG: hypothetical protein JRH19_24210, partial [Deltaproteobacteria bacterium]|nr:hypothetical protein [Deltaproteobacteria bacterium]
MTRWGCALLVVIFLGLPLFASLDARDLGNDEAIYTFAVVQMLEEGDWLTPKSIFDRNAPFL